MKKQSFFSIAILATLSMLSMSATAKTSNDLFSRMKSERVESSPIVEWRNVGPGMSGYNETMVIHPADDNVMFLGPDMRVAYGTWNKGETWETIKDCDGSGRDMEWVLNIEFSRQDPNYGLATSTKLMGCEVYETRDMGRSWQWISSLGKVHRAMAINPKNDQIVYLGAGDFWNIKGNHRTRENIHGTIISRAVYGHVLKSTDGGRTWKKIATDISDKLDVGKIIFNEKDPENLIMATSHGVYATKNGGKTWSSSSKGLPIDKPRDMVSHVDKKSGKQTLFLVEQTTYEPAGRTIVSNGGLFRSDDFGATWVDITGDMGLDLTQISDFFTKLGYYKTLSHWFGITPKEAEKLYPELPKQALPTWNRLVVNPSNINEIYLSHEKKADFSFGPGDVWTSKNGGKSWYPTARSGAYWSKGINKEYWKSKGIEANMNTKYAHVHEEMTTEPERQGCRHMVINSKGELFVGLAQQTLISSNGGESWEQIDDIEITPNSNQWTGRGTSNMPGRLMVMETGIKGRKLFCSGEHGLFKSVPLGDYPDKEAAAFEQIEGQIRPKAAHSVSTVAVHPNDPNTIYILAWRQYHRGALRRTTDGGKSWENISTIHEANNNFSQGLTPQASLMIDPENPNNMYFCAIRKSIQEVGNSPKENILTKGEYGIYRSTDAGYTWESANVGLPKMCSVNRLTMDPKNPKKIYASVNQINDKDLTAGLYVSEDGARSFTKLKTLPKQITSVNDLSFTKSGDMLLSCGRKDGAVNAGGVYRSKDGGKKWEKIFDAPYIWHAVSSPINPDYLMVTVPYHSIRVGKQSTVFPNPGVYLSKDGGESWIKINRGLGQPDKIVEIAFDPDEKDVIWCASWGCGWFKARIK